MIDEDMNVDAETGPPASDRPTGSTPEGYRRLAGAFTRGGERYERLRPSYPAAAVDWLLDGLPAGSVTADIGAGTGKLSAALADRGMTVTAVDPSADMLAQLHRRLPSVRITVGTGEATGLADHTVALATFGQSWHWVDPAQGAAELSRILAWGGRVGWVWNFLDERVDWVADLVAIWHSIAGTESAATHRPPELPESDPPAFAPIESTVVEWTVPMSVTDLIDLVTTRSYYLAAEEPVRRDVHERSAALLSSCFGPTEQVRLPYQTRCYRCTRTGPRSNETG